MARRTGPVLILASLILAGGAAWLANRWVNTRARLGGPPTTHFSGLHGPASGYQVQTRHVAQMEAVVGRTRRLVS
jgi:hypothetical protein